MKIAYIIASIVVLAVLVGLNVTLVPAETTRYGGLSWAGWSTIALVGLGIGLFVVFSDSARAFGFYRSRDQKAAPPVNIRTLSEAELRELKIDKYRGPSYPHPVIFRERCIGCQSCVDACPHDVLAIVDGVASAVAPDLCMEDTACQAECPVNPKACIVINTSKEVRSLPTPTRDGSTFETNVPGCYIIGDVSGVPLIKNAVKEGADVIKHIADELHSAPADANADFDVAIIGIGPGGASAAATAQEKGLKYIAIEQDKVLATIQLYPKGKYIFFKPDTKDWAGGIPVAGLGLAKAKYGGGDTSDDEQVIEAIGPQLTDLVHANASALHAQVLAAIPPPLQPNLSELLEEKLEKELKKRVVLFLRGRGQGDWARLYQSQFLPNSARHLESFSAEIADQLQTKIPGDQRENILDVWLGSLDARGVRINEQESCKAVTKADPGDHFIVNTEQGAEKVPQSYRARRVVIAIGLRGAPNKLRLPNEDMKIKVEGKTVDKVIYGLSNPMDFQGFRIAVVGGGNVAVEAAVDLVATRDGNSIAPRAPQQMNQVTLLVRDYLAPTVKFGNKFQLYQCADDGIIDLRFGVGIKEMREGELVLENVKTKEIVGTIPNDYVFALIGGERPNRFLESIGITIK